jgi:hypothetical protein
MLELRDGTRKSDNQFSYSLKFASNQPTRWLVLCWSIFNVRTSHWQFRTHKIHYSPDSGEATTFPHIVYSTPLRKGHIQMAFCFGTPEGESLGVLKLPRLELLQLCWTITSCSGLLSGRSLKQSCSSCRKFFNDVSHTTCTCRTQVNS